MSRPAADRGRLVGLDDAALREATTEAGSLECRLAWAWLDRRARDVVLCPTFLDTRIAPGVLSWRA